MKAAGPRRMLRGIFGRRAQRALCGVFVARASAKAPAVVVVVVVVRLAIATAVVVGVVPRSVRSVVVPVVFLGTVRPGKRVLTVDIEGGGV